MVGVTSSKLVGMHRVFSMFTGHAESCTVPRVGVVQCFRRPHYETVQQMRMFNLAAVISTQWTVASTCAPFQSVY